MNEEMMIKENKLLKKENQVLEQLISVKDEIIANEQSISVAQSFFITGYLLGEKELATSKKKP